MFCHHRKDYENLPDLLVLFLLTAEEVGFVINGKEGEQEEQGEQDPSTVTPLAKLPPCTGAEDEPDWASLVLQRFVVREPRGVVSAKTPRVKVGGKQVHVPRERLEKLRRLEDNLINEFIAASQEVQREMRQEFIDWLNSEDSLKGW